MTTSAPFIDTDASSPNRHATKHFHASGHPVMRSAESGETWGWC